MAKIKNLKFHNFGGYPLYEYASMFGSESIVYFQRRFRLQVFSPIWFHLNENEEKIIKIQKCNILRDININKMKNGLEIWRTGSFPPKLALVRLTVSEKTGLRTTAGMGQHLICCAVVQSRANRENF